MKNHFKNLACLLLLLTSSYYANSTIIASYSFARTNSAGILGAGTVEKISETKFLGRTADGEDIVSVREKINCSGCCFKSCPETFSPVKNDPEPPLVGEGIEDASVAAIDELMLYALNEINNSNNSGNHGFTQAIVNQNNITYTYYFSVNWSVSADGVTTITVNREKID